MELRKGIASPLSISVPQSAQNITAEFFINDVQVGNIQSLSVTNGVATFTPPYAAVANQGRLRIDVQFAEESDYFTKTQYFDVVAPYLEIMDLRKIMNNATDDARWDMESVVRAIIDSYTGQHFYSVDKTLTVRGTGADFLRLPERLMVLQGLKTLTTTLDITDSIITGDGWYLKKGWTSGNDYTPTGNKYFTDTDAWWMNHQPGEPGYQQYDHGYVISAPRLSALPTPWMKDYPFSVTGTWGYDQVPQAVRAAALLLVNDYSCNEVLYRDRYLNAVKFADTDIDFSGASWGGTGNVRADQLLSEYVIADWAVL